MKIAWLGADTSLETPIGNNLIRRSPKFAGDTIGWPTVLTQTEVLADYDLIGVWCGVHNLEVLTHMPKIRAATDGKIITNLWAPGSSEPAWHIDHQAKLINNTQHFDALISSHYCHIEQYRVLGVPTYHLPHPIDLSKYPEPRSRPEIDTIMVGSGGIVSGRGFFYSLITYKALKKKFPKIKGFTVVGTSFINATHRLLMNVLKEDPEFVIFEGRAWPEYSKEIRDVGTLHLLNFTYSGFDRTTMDNAALGIPTITPMNLFSGELFPYLKIEGYWATEGGMELASKLLTDEMFYNDCVEYGMSKIKEHDIKKVENIFQLILRDIGL